MQARRTVTARESSSPSRKSERTGHWSLTQRSQKVLRLDARASRNVVCARCSICTAWMKHTRYHTAQAAEPRPLTTWTATSANRPCTTAARRGATTAQPGLLAGMPLIVSLPFGSVRETDVWQAPRVLRTTGSERLTAERPRSAATIPIPYVYAGKFGDAGEVRRKILTAGTNA